MRKVVFALAVCLAGLAVAGCQIDGPSGSTRETRATLQLQNEAAVTVGVPAIKNFTEKRQLKEIYELRDTANLVTYTYTLDRNGKRHKVCPSTSVGFGIPYATQFTAPKAARVVHPIWPDGTRGSGIDEMMDQPEPNGLYMPNDANATWVLCLKPDKSGLAPTYVEPNVEVYLFPMQTVD